MDRTGLGQTIIKSDLEERFLAFLDAQGLPRPLANEKIGPYLVDALWPQQRLIVELDSHQAHLTTRGLPGRPAPATGTC